MHQGKQKGGNCYQIYTAAIQEKSYDLLMLESALHHALERKEFVVYYQPQVDVTTGLIVGASALVRCPHPQRGLVSPADFIPVAEETLQLLFLLLLEVAPQLIVLLLEKTKRLFLLNLNDGF